MSLIDLTYFLALDIKPNRTESRLRLFYGKRKADIAQPYDAVIFLSLILLNNFSFIFFTMAAPA